MKIKIINMFMDKGEVKALLGEPGEVLLDDDIWFYPENKIYIRFNTQDYVIGWQEELEVSCPVCGEKIKLRPIVYGTLGPRMMERLEKDEFIHGGIYSTEISPLWGLRCLKDKENYSIRNKGERLAPEIEKSLAYSPRRIKEDKTKKPKPLDRGQLSVERK